MKSLMFMALTFLIPFAAKAQLKNTEWVGKIAAPAEVEVVLQFKSDTLQIVIAGTDNVIESMKYSVKDDVITINKILGGSPCSNDQTATLKYIIKNDHLMIVTVNDPCDDRKNAWPPDGFVKH